MTEEELYVAFLKILNSPSKPQVERMIGLAKRFAREEIERAMQPDIDWSSVDFMGSIEAGEYVFECFQKSSHQQIINLQ